MSGIDENGIPLQERIEVENRYEKYKRERERLKATQDKFMEEVHAEQLRIYASMAETERAFVFDDIGRHEVVLIDEDFSLQRRQRESNHGILNSILNRMRGRRSESYSRRNNRRTRESDVPTIDFVA